MQFKTFLSAILVLLFSQPLIAEIKAQNDSFYELLKILRDSGTLSEKEYNSLIKASKKIHSPSETRFVKKERSSLPIEKSWPQKIQIKGGIRVRYQYNHLENRLVGGNNSPDSRHRGRLRGKIGLVGKPLSGWVAGIGLTSGSNNPRGTNVDLGDTFSSKNLLLDYAYAEHNRTAISWIAGKFNKGKYLWNTTDLMWDSDITPEGFSARYAHSNTLGSYWANLGVWVLEEEQSSSEDPYLVYFQLGQALEADSLQVKFAGTKYLYVDMNKSQISQTFRHSSNTNRDNNLNAIQVSGELNFKNGSDQFGFFTDLIKNVETNSNENFAYSIGFQILRPPWKFKYIYAKLEHDSIPDFLPDSDRFNGHTGIKGHEAELHYRLNKSLRLRLDFYSTEDYETNIKQNILQTDILLDF